MNDPHAPDRLARLYAAWHAAYEDAHAALLRDDRAEADRQIERANALAREHAEVAREGAPVAWMSSFDALAEREGLR